MSLQWVTSQLEELELMLAVFPAHGEMEVDLEWQQLARSYLDGKASPPPTLQYRIRPPLDQLQLELTVQLPLQYPTQPPEDNVHKYINPIEPVTTPVPAPPDKTYSRFWIYSHHIYSKTKRKDMLSLADEYRVTGFMLSGKPGIVCVEGDKDDCEHWWADVKAMNWKKIVVKKAEDFPIGSEFVRKFSNFEEITFHGSSRGSDHHMDMGEFYKYLNDHDCSYVFVDYFGMSGRPAS
ncbi:RWD domain-containing protein 2B isoform X2 [Arctopsyche grandis]|uniref:RWD domain-containing protein 2B isoform X2 n=1 Tax=Arctopsyche grandis TaxID=121162 RepID=UPI00406D6B83